MSEMLERAARALWDVTDDGSGEYEGVEVALSHDEARAALLAALDPEAITPMLKDKIRTHYWNHHGAREPSDEFVDDLASMIVIGLRLEADPNLLAGTDDAK